MASIRAFVAVLLPEEVRAVLAEAAAGLRRVAPEVAWTAPSNLHLTLKFLGAVEDTRVDDIRRVLAAAAAGASPFWLALRGLGAFPSATRPRVLWASAIEGAEAAAALASLVDARLAELGIAREARPFAAHVTLGRVREPRRNAALAEALAAAARVDLGRVRVDRLSLVRSELSPRGARYSELAACPLG